MQASELRIGNWIADRGRKEWQIDHWESINNVSAKPPTFMCNGFLTEGHPLTEYVDYLYPIPLTEEWVLKFGFDKTSYSEFEFLKNSSFRLCGFGWTIEQYTIPFGWVELNTLSIKYVHQLQNLYFALTGEELTI